MGTVKISGTAHQALAQKMREWSAWPNSGLVFEDTTAAEVGAPFAYCDWGTKTFHVNADVLVRNPNRVINSVTPFRLKQEAVLTGVMLHEAAHTRYTRWVPRTPEQAAAFTHRDGSPVSAATMALARCAEEARIEGRVYADAAGMGVSDLTWTMRVAALTLLPFTPDTTDPAQAIMGWLQSWILRAGRVEAAQLSEPWVGVFTNVLRGALETYFSGKHGDFVVAARKADAVHAHMLSMIRNPADTGTLMVDRARNILNLLFPETPEDQRPSVGGSACAESGGSDSGESEAGDSGEGEGSGSDSDSGEGSGSGSGSGSDSGEGSGSDSDEDTLIITLAELEADASEATQETDATASKGQGEGTPPKAHTPGSGAGHGGKPADSAMTWREPGAEDRSLQKHAERFLRELLDASESSADTITDSPSAMVDGAALSAWRASGGTRDPRFFKRTTRNIEPSPPVQVAILVDVSLSMGPMQKPSALLSWSLAAAAMDMQNFAGRGQQISVVLIHWGSAVHLVRSPGERMTNIPNRPCLELTHAFPEAMSVVEQAMPEFFTRGEKPANRLLVNFTDWDFSRWVEPASSRWLAKALHSGVNMLSVTPPSNMLSMTPPSNDYHFSKLMKGVPPGYTGRVTTLHYDNSTEPSEVWSQAAALLR